VTGMEVLVVDNASDDGTADLLATRFPQIRTLRTPRNLGFAGGAAAGTAGFTGDAIVLLNDDATFEDGAVAALLAALDAPGAERVGAVTARLLLTGRYRRDASGTWVRTDDDDPDGIELVNSTGNVVDDRGAGGDRDWMAPVGQESDDAVVFGFCGGAAALRRTALEEVGGFDADLFLYYEDTDLSWRLRSRGWRTRYVAGAVARHQHAASSGVRSPVFRYHNTRNSLTVVTRHAPARLALTSWTRQTAGSVRALVHDGPSDPVMRARLRGLRDASVRLPRTLVERHRIWHDARGPRSPSVRF
jgi:N-acetylglucosaminyl-diphospho-decaprenol L-rhamnosyltransferase